LLGNQSVPFYGSWQNFSALSVAKINKGRENENSNKKTDKRGLVTYKLRLFYFYTMASSLANFLDPRDARAVVLSSCLDPLLLPVALDEAL